MKAATTAGLAARCAGVHWDDLPRDVRERAKDLVLDLIGVAIRGSRQPSSIAARDTARRLGGEGRSSVIGNDLCLPASWAALANGTAGHALELDDVTSESSLHPGVAVIPAALALAEERGTDGRAFLEAVVAGYEATMRIGNALGAASAYQRGFHPTGVAGAFGATAAAARLMELDAPATTRAFGVAGTMASGSLEYLSDGTWTKRLNPGWAGHVGIVAAQLAADGFRGPATAIEGRLGTLRAYSDSARPELLAAPADDDWALMQVSIKPYACCRYNHGLIDGVLKLAAEHRIVPQDVARIRLGVLSAGAVLVSEPIDAKRVPRNVVDAQFSAPFAAAVALTHRAAGIAEYIQENVDDDEIRGLMARTDCVRDDSLDAVYPTHWPSWVEIELRHGRTVRTRVDDASGEPANPITREALLRKFGELAGDVIGRHEELAARVIALETETDMSGIGTLVRDTASSSFDRQDRPRVRSV
ncbi:MAG TPA: MmgE/PrpD family protein [Candidatus Limnocylindria bacterium]|nr:MmgE/PrpD family protein [Candidatus Limnocylindria bacterium]